MFRIDTPNRFVDLFGPGKPGFRDGDKALGINPTELSAAQQNALQEELAGVIEAAGIVLNKANNAQLLEALKRLIDAQSGNYALDTGAANAYVVALDPPIAAYADGMTIRVKVANANTGASTLNAGAGAVPWVNDVGGALAGGDLPAGGIAAVTYIAAAGKFYTTSLVQSQGDARYAALAGLVSQVFSIGMGTAASHAARLEQVSLYPAVASAATIDPFGAAGATINVTGITTVTGITACAAGQVGSSKTLIPSNAAGFSITASASLIVDGATSGTYLLPQNANVQLLATSVNTFKITTLSGSAKQGTTTNDSAIAGNVGEIISSSVGVTSLTNSIFTNLTSISLSPGDWDVDGTVCFDTAATTNLTQVLGGVSNTSGTTDSVESRFVYAWSNAGIVLGVNSIQSPIKKRRISVPAGPNLPIYLVARGLFSVSTLTALGTITARRVR